MFNLEEGYIKGRLHAGREAFDNITLRFELDSEEGSHSRLEPTHGYDRFWSWQELGLEDLNDDQVISCLQNSHIDFFENILLVGYPCLALRVVDNYHFNGREYLGLLNRYDGHREIGGIRHALISDRSSWNALDKKDLPMNLVTSSVSYQIDMIYADRLSHNNVLQLSLDLQNQRITASAAVEDNWERTR